LRTYEVVYIAGPNTSDDDLKKLASQIEQIITSQGGTITKIDNMGRRKLAYRIGKFEEGIYTVVYLEGSGQEIYEIERRLRVTDYVIRHQTVRTDEELKRSEKMKAKRRGAAATAVRRVDDDFADLDLNEEEREALEEM
jgi:small subunit ribosomal protein S6